MRTSLFGTLLPTFLPTFLPAFSSLAASAFVSVALVGCSADALPNDDAIASSTAALDAPASHCELFVDRATTVRGSHGLLKTTLYLKTQNDRLAWAGGVEEVGYVAKLTDNGTCNGPECRDKDVFRAYPAVPFVGASDYFEISLTLDHDYTAARTYEGAFYVRTKSGTTLWVTPEGGGNFFIDRRLAQDIERLRGTGPVYTSGPERAVVTADVLPYLNPNACR
jgi:hypothetical protein